MELDNDDENVIVTTEIELRQTGRALMDFEVAVRRRAGALQRQSEARLAMAGVTAQTLPDDMDARHDLIDATLADYRPWHWRGLLGDYCAGQHGIAALTAFAEVEDALEPQLAAQDQGPVTPTIDPGFEAPAYWARSWFHRTHGGWDGHPRNGFIHAEIVHRHYVAKVFPGDIYANRRAVARLAPRRDYGRILELGTSSGHYTAALSEVFPDAAIVGLDPSARMLEQAARVGNARGLSWDLRVGVGEATGLEDASFDMVTAYAIHHEVPPRVVAAIYAEAMRVLRSGGTLLIADVARYADLDRLAAWRFDWVARHGGEPFWRPTAMLDLATMAREAGFADVSSGSVNSWGDPHHVLGTKP